MFYNSLLKRRKDSISLEDVSIDYKSSKNRIMGQSTALHNKAKSLQVDSFIEFMEAIKLSEQLNDF